MLLLIGKCKKKQRKGFTKKQSKTKKMSHKLEEVKGIVNGVPFIYGHAVIDRCAVRLHTYIHTYRSRTGCVC